MKLSSTFLIESKSARDEGLQAIRSREPEQDILNKVKSLMFAVWDGSSRVSRQQLADFYEVPVATIDSNYKRNREEFESDGVRVFKGKDLKEVRGIMPLTSSSPQETIYTATGALRMGFILRDSPVAHQVRNVAIKIIQGVEQQVTSQIVVRELVNDNPVLSPMIQGGVMKVSAPYALYWDKMKATLRKEYPTGGIPGKSQEDIRKDIQFCSTYTDHFKLQGIKELSRQIAGNPRGQYPSLISDQLTFESDGHTQSMVIMFQFQDLVVTQEYVQECLGRGYIETAKNDLGVNQAALVFVAPFGATSYAEDYIYRYIPESHRGYVGVLTVKELADALYTQAWEARQLGTAKGEITKEFKGLTDYDFPDPPQMYDQQELQFDLPESSSK